VKLYILSCLMCDFSQMCAFAQTTTGSSPHPSHQSNACPRLTAERPSASRRAIQLEWLLT